MDPFKKTRSWSTIELWSKYQDDPNPFRDEVTEYFRANHKGASIKFRPSNNLFEIVFNSAVAAGLRVYRSGLPVGRFYTATRKLKDSLLLADIAAFIPHSFQSEIMTLKADDYLLSMYGIPKEKLQLLGLILIAFILCI